MRPAWSKSLGRSALIAGLSLASAAPAAASWLDSDFYCRVYGCVIVHDGFTFDVYDNYVFATGGTVAPGQPMIAWTGNPFDGAGEVNPVITGTRTEGLYAVPLEDQGVTLGIDTNGDGTPDRLPVDANGNGFLDASDSLDPFALTSSTRLVSATSSAQRSFYLSSRTDFYVVAESRLLGTPDALNDPAQLSNISFLYDVTRSGTDDGMRFGQNARGGNYIRTFGNADDLLDLYQVPTQIMEFRNSIRLRDAVDLPSQSIRFDYVYDFEDYDLSLGEGHLQYEIEFSFYNR
ncbi:MAG: hypothetical protein AAGJ85_08700 [Pseudomonadota bacterium]